MTRKPGLIRAQEEYDAKTVKLNLRLRRAEKERLDELAKLADVTPTTLIRRWIERGEI
jgi:predicted DNA-binding protein